jgi:ferredoxin--NADP+ reductase
MTRHFAIIGSGPSGIYAAERLARIAPDDRVDVIDRLPTPFGLIRYGVAPDHQSTKAVTRILGRALSRDNVRFFGNITVGRDVALDDLRDFYDAVIIATGAPKDRRLGIPGEDLPGVHRSGEFVGWYNDHPDYSDLPVKLEGVTDLVVVGVGNVALDVARVFAKSPTELTTADLAPDLANKLANLPLRSITLLGRRRPEHARFTALELAEMGGLERAMPIVDPEAFPVLGDDEPKPLSILRDFAIAEAVERPVRLEFRFQSKPVAFEATDRLTGVRVAGPNGKVTVLPAQLAVTCIGYDSIACDRLQPTDHTFSNSDGKIEHGLYVVGWAKRGPSGTIPTNRPESHAVASRVAAETNASGKIGSTGLIERIAANEGHIVDYSGWQAIDSAELSRAMGDRPRRKFRSIAELIAAAEV